MEESNMKNNRNYSIIISYNGDTTTAMLVDENFRCIKSTTAKRNPNDKPSLRIGAQVAFDRLWEKKEKSEKPAEKGGFKVGDRVVANGRCLHSGKHGRIVAIKYSSDCYFAEIGVEFDNYICGHDCGGNAKQGHGWWLMDLFVLHEQPTKQKVREVKRHAKVGEWVKIVDADRGNGEKYANGDVLRVEKVCRGNLDGWVELSCGGTSASPHEYVVLEGYQPGRDSK
jgi:hypothetical protein